MKIEENINYIEKANYIKERADKFLEKKNIIKMLEKYGQVFFTGSFSTNLMVWNDIDIQLILKKPENKIGIFSEITKELLSDQDIKKIELINFTPGKKPEMPIGLYMGLQYKLNNDKWKVDIWSLEEPYLTRDREFNSLIKSKLDCDSKFLILKMKNMLMADSDRVPQLASYYIYKAVFEERLNTEQEILSYLKEKGVKF